MKKILHIIPIFATGGAERLVLQYAKLLPKDKFEVYAASCVEDGELRPQFENYAKTVFIGSRQSAGSRQAVYKQLEKFAEKIQPDVVHTHLLSADFFGYLLKRKWKNKIKWVSTMHNVETAASYPRQLLWRFILRRADKVISVCHKVEKFTLREFKVKKSRSQMVLNGIELEQWLKVPNDSLLSREQIQLACIGRFWEQKGHKYLFSALAQIKDLPWRLHLFGDGPLRRELEKQAQDLKINDRIAWRGVVHNIADELKNIDVIIQPSLWEGLSLVVMEAMASGRLVIATQEAGEELLENKKTGLTAPARNPEALAKAIIWTAKHRQDAGIIASAGREYAKKNFGIERNIKEAGKIYENA